MYTIHRYMYQDDLILHENIREHRKWNIGTAWIDLTPRGLDYDPFRMWSIFHNGHWIVTVAPLRYWIFSLFRPRIWINTAQLITRIVRRFLESRNTNTG